MDDIMKMVKCLEDSGWLLKGVDQTIENKAKKQKKTGSLIMLLGTLAASLLKNRLRVKDVLWGGAETTKAGQDF